MSSKIQTAERVSGADASDNYVFQRSLLAYYLAADMVSGDVLEIGTGSGYGVAVISPHVKKFVTVDKFNPEIGPGGDSNVEYLRMKVPPLSGMADSSFDYVITFQVIEHIRKDEDMIREIHRVLRPGGRLIISTPNIKMSLTRNPWHIREYTASQFSTLLGRYFQKIEPLGIFGNDKVMEYYRQNKASVARFEKLDFLRMRKWMPRWALKIPYDILNRINRRKLLDENRNLTTGISMKDYHSAPVADNCFDLFYIARK